MEPVSSPQPEHQQPAKKQPRSISIKLDARLLSALLFIIILVMLGLWRPWQETAVATDRKLTVNGSATIKATPDEFVFYPTFERTGPDADALKQELNTFGTKLNDDLKKLGVKENDIELDSDSYNTYYNSRQPGNKTVTLHATITVPNKELAQKVQDYLAKTDAKGQLTSQASFSEDKRKELENEARQKAITDARKKADQSAQNLDAKVGKILEVKDSFSGYGLYDNVLNTGAEGGASNRAQASLPVTPGTDKITGNVQVVFQLK